MSHLSERIQVFTNRHPLIGPVFWLVSVQYLITQLVVAAGWPRAYSWLHNTISDLGVTSCDQLVCSPYATWMNSSFVVLGCTMIAGSTLIYQSFQKSRASLTGFIFMALAGVGTILVGIFPSNTVEELHVLGAALPFVLGNLAMIILGLALKLPRWLTVYSVLSGAIALIALVLFLSETYFGIGKGGMERVAAYPQTFWLITFGIYMSANRYRVRNQTAGH